MSSVSLADLCREGSQTWIAYPMKGSGDMLLGAMTWMPVIWGDQS